MRKVIWGIVFFITLSLFFMRFIFSALCGTSTVQDSIIHFFECCLLLYISFLIEGIILATTKIEDYDDESLEEEMRKRYGPADELGPRLLKLKRKSGNILVGQPLVAIAVTFLFGALLSESSLPELGGFNVPKNGTCSVIFSWQNFKWLYFLNSNNYVSLALSTMLIYWIAQYLPQSLGKKSSVEFIRRLFPVTFIADFLALIAKSGIGLPGEGLEWIFEKLGFKGTTLNLPLSDAKFLEAMSTDYERYIEKRSIVIESKEDGISITDSVKFVYLVPRTEVDFLIKIPEAQYDKAHGVDIKFEFPPGHKAEKAANNEIYFNYLNKDILGGVDGLESSDFLWGATIFTLQSSSDSELAYATVVASYKHTLKQFNSDRADTNVLFFDIVTPTKEIEVTIRHLPDQFIHKAGISFLGEESRILGRLDPIHRGRFSEKKIEDGKILTHYYPPLADEMVLKIDMRAAET